VLRDAASASVGQILDAQLMHDALGVRVERIDEGPVRVAPGEDRWCGHAPGCTDS